MSHVSHMCDLYRRLVCIEHFECLHTATHCNTMQLTAPHCKILQHATTHCNTLQHTATHYNTLQHIATHCNTLQHTARHLVGRERDHRAKNALAAGCRESYVSPPQTPTLHTWLFRSSSIHTKYLPLYNVRKYLSLWASSWLSHAQCLSPLNTYILLHLFVNLSLKISPSL